MGEPLHDRSLPSDGVLVDSRAAMKMAAEHLTALSIASRQFGGALVAAGFPESAWHSQHALLHQLSDSLPHISIGAWLTRLESFADQDGLAWLPGTSDDLASFRAEAVALQAIADPLCAAVERLHEPAMGTRLDRLIELVLRHPEVLPPLQELAMRLGKLVALAPFLQPMAPRTSAQNFNTEDTERIRRLFAVHLVFTFGLLRALRRLRGPRVERPFRTIAGVRRTIVGVRGTPIRTRQLAVVLGGVLLLAVATLALARVLPNDSSTVPHSPSSAAGRASIAAHQQRSTAAPTPTSSRPTATPSPQTAATPSPPATSTPALQLGLACAVHGATATLAIRNAGAIPFTWQAEPPPTLSVSPAQGTLDAGQSTTAQVTARHKKPVNGTVVVRATQGTSTTSSSVACQ